MTASESRTRTQVPQEQTFEDQLVAEGLACPERREFIAGLLRQVRELERVAVWPASAEPGESEIGLYWRIWRNQGRPDGFEVLCWQHAATGQVAQLRQNTRPARERDFMYLDTLPPTCARCGWTNGEVLERRERAHAEERAWREANRG